MFYFIKTIFKDPGKEFDFYSEEDWQDLFLTIRILIIITVGYASGILIGYLAKFLYLLTTH
jgi:hypothetical protein